MPRATRKYLAADEAAKKLGITTTGMTAPMLYQTLQTKGYEWDAGQQLWLSALPAQPASDLLRLRVWTRGDLVNQVADRLVRLVEGADMNLLERSEAYPCRSPKQGESRVYLTFVPRPK